VKLVISEDKTELLSAINIYLINENHICELEEHFFKADEKSTIYSNYLILLDNTLPVGNGLELLKK
jgi:DNA-binding response OmpR family regulator